MPPTSKLRRFFHALSVLSAMACLLLIALWVRSYWRRDTYVERFGQARKLIANSTQGTLVVTYSTRVPDFSKGEGWFTTSRHPNEYEWQSLERFSKKRNYFGSRIFALSGVVTAAFPTLYLVLLFGLASLVTGLYFPVCRFSLRTLMIAATLVAVVLGIIALAAG